MQPGEQFSHIPTIPPEAVNSRLALERLMMAEPHDPSQEEIRNTTEAFLEYLPYAGGKYFQNVADLYESLKGEPLYVRREDPHKVFDFLAEGKPINLRQKEEARPNAALWSYEKGQRGLENAFLEGHTQLNGAVTILGFTPDHVEKRKLEGELSSITFPGGKKIDRSAVVSLIGEIPKEDIKFLIVRLLAKYVPAEDLTEEEQERLLEKSDKGPQYVLRGVLFEQPTVH